MKTLIKFPFKGEPEQFKIAYNRWNNERVHIVCSFDRHDKVDTPQFKKWLLDNHIEAYWNEAKGKIRAVNANLQGQDFDLMILASADMVPQCAEYDLRISELFKQSFSNGDGVLHLNDGIQGESLNTLCILDKKYYYRFGYIYHPSYQSLWSDNEFMEVSRRLGMAKYIDECIVRHEWDFTNPVIAKNQRWFSRDKANFENRKLRGFPK